MRADRDKRASILTAEGNRQSAILTAEGNKQSAILNAEGDREAAILRAQAERESSILQAQGEGQAIQTVFQAIHDGRPDQSLLAYQYLQMIPKIAEGDANKMWIVPSEIGKALEGLGSTMNSLQGIPDEVEGPRKRVVDRAVGGHRPGGRRRGRRRRAPTCERAIAEAAARRPSAAAARPRSLDPDAGPRAPTTGAPSPARASRRSLLAGVAAGAHQHRRGLGHARHLPDPAGARRAAGDRQRLQQHRAGARVGDRRRSATAASCAASATGCCAWRRPRCCGGAAGAVLLLGLPEGAFGAIVPVLIVLALVLVVVQPRLSARVRPRRTRDGGRPRGAGGCGRPSPRRASTAATSGPPRASC